MPLRSEEIRSALPAKPVRKNPAAKKFSRLKYMDVLNRGLAVMDSTATSLCMDNKIPIVVFNIDDHTNILKAAVGEDIGTIVGGDEA